MLHFTLVEKLLPLNCCKISNSITKDGRYAYVDEKFNQHIPPHISAPQITSIVNGIHHSEDDPTFKIYENEVVSVFDVTSDEKVTLANIFTEIKNETGKNYFLIQDAINEFVRKYIRLLHKPNYAGCLTTYFAFIGKGGEKLLVSIEERMDDGQFTGKLRMFFLKSLTMKNLVYCQEIHYSSLFQLNKT